MLAVSSSRRQDTDGELGGESSGGQGDCGIEMAVSKEGQEMAEDDEVDGLLEGPGSSKLFTLGVIILVTLLIIDLKMEDYLETLNRLGVVVGVFS